MGGLAIVASALIGWLVAHTRDIAFSDQAMIVWVGILGMSFMGFLDDWIKVKKVTTEASSGSRKTTSRC